MDQEDFAMGEMTYFKAHVSYPEGEKIEYYSMPVSQYEMLLSGDARLNRKMLYVEPMEVVYGIVGCYVNTVNGYASKISSIEHMFLLEKESEFSRTNFIDKCKKLNFYNSDIDPKILIKYPGYLILDKEITISAENIIRTEEITGAIISNNMVVIEMAMRKFLENTLNIKLN